MGIYSISVGSAGSGEPTRFRTMTEVFSLTSLDKAIDRFCYKHPRFGIPNLIRYIIMIDAVVYLFAMMDRSGTFLALLSFLPDRILAGQVWRLVTFIFIPTSTNIFLYAITLYFYYVVGDILEREWGTTKFTLYYVSGVVLTVIAALLLGLATGSSYITLASAYYVNLSLFFAFATLYPENTVLLFFILPIKMKWLGWFSAALFAWEIISMPFPVNLLPVVALLNYAAFFSSYISDFFRRLFRRTGMGNTVRFRAGAARVRKQQKQQGYRHKCAVCGKTDAEYPNMEFRYCSRCNGYYCYCPDHINSHVHIQ